ncbi:MAG: hydroxyisourate hydrolase [Pseudomonadota bacterium]
MSQITTHILDTGSGRPAEGVALSLYALNDNDWQELASGTTNADGRVANLLPDDKVLDAGHYRMHFATGDYFADQQLATFYPWVDIVFEIAGDGQHYHVPLLLSAFGYSTYRGS